ncbi:GNAT family N-acetyltransferase [bacterium]|nr:MAG: GNAT family N-acetyltransferase [bacterium]
MDMSRQNRGMSLPSLSILHAEEAERFRQPVLDRLHGFNQACLGPYDYHPIAVVLHGEEGELLGGAVGGVHLGWLAIDLVWMHADHRGQGYGSRLLRTMEETAKAQGAHRAYLDTTTFQAPKFYERHGYVEEARLVDFANGHDRIYMTKRVL